MVLKFTNMEFNIKELRREVFNMKVNQVFDDSTYDSLLHAAKILFPGCVFTTDKSIFIRDKINLELSLSWNETKIYVYNYFLPDPKTPWYDNEPIDNDQQYEVRRINNSFRFFALETMIQYLNLKKIENDFIKENEG